MMKKKVTKSFADALLSADADVDLLSKPKKVKPKPNKSSHTSSSKEKTSHKSVDFSTKSSSKSYAKSSHQDSRKSSSSSSRNFSKSSSQNKIQRCHSSDQDKKSNLQNTSLDPFLSPFSINFRKSAGDSDSDSDDVDMNDAQNKSLEHSSVEKTKFVSNRKAGKADKRVAKLLAEEEERQKNAKILQSVDEDLMLYDLQLEDDLKMETESQEVIHISVLPPGIPFLHSLTCHTLYAPG
ncbi:hypothetical protein FHG87_023657 [Trinorchestia longiramus]|nr:hypothetical protein FHG87_023657 [Trinorchestia longiramus]